ncbi:MAG TPA: lipid A deacylase LpxR family protein [Nitrospirae bacterium]|nr:hypothetical protein BMS3Abin10_02034 [bacterium BMS3Abin10]GBE39379.1 hypothetical protein BMS3Bbin08_02001 [bacterium BMS3Bbin08]HDH50618.1 lipid A deacylase LpxR family protein [Nitrospirota bacterium]HDK80938.1 lipid A deacylase LpxR family protein [Nitrospirota bacterium]
MRYKVFIVVMQCLMLCPALPAAADHNPWTSTFYFENDLFNGTDSQYTNGVKLSIISPDLSPHAHDGQLPRRVMEFVHKIPFIGESPPNYTHKVEFAIGQNMYTPSDTGKFELIENDRPYAGWTYISTAYHRKNEAKDIMSFMDTVEIQLGIVGPESYAEETQKLVHELRDLDQPNGWDNQLKNEPGLVIVFERKWLFHPVDTEKFGYSAITHAGVAVGNVHTYLNAGLELRLGWNIPRDFGVSLIRPAGSTRLEIGDTFMIFAFGAVNGRAVARDIFLDGNTFTDSHSIAKNYFVADIAGGLAVNYKKFIITWTQVLRTKEFKGQKNEHSFGAIAISYSFPFDLT